MAVADGLPYEVPPVSLQLSNEISNLHDATTVARVATISWISMKFRDPFYAVAQWIED